MQARGEFIAREEVARIWFEEEFEPVIAMIREADLLEVHCTETEAYARVVSLRYLLLRTHAWDEEVLERLREELRRRPSPGEDTFERRLRSDLEAERALL